MRASRKLNRRSFVGTVLGGVVVSGGATLLVTGRADAQNVRYTGVTDSDTGEHADRPGYGTGTRSQYTDQDRGPNADAQFHGRGPNGRGKARLRARDATAKPRRAARTATAGPARIPADAASAATVRPRRATIRPAIPAIAPIPIGARAPIRCSRGGAAEACAEVEGACPLRRGRSLRSLHMPLVQVRGA